MKKCTLRALESQSLCVDRVKGHYPSSQEAVCEVLQGSSLILSASPIVLPLLQPIAFPAWFLGCLWLDPLFLKVKVRECPSFTPLLWVTFPLTSRDFRGPEPTCHKQGGGSCQSFLPPDNHLSCLGASLALTLAVSPGC